jgi:hypothetical protein
MGWAVALRCLRVSAEHEESKLKSENAAASTAQISHTTPAAMQIARILLALARSRGGCACAAAVSRGG